jgi:hypothetical protein
MRENRTYGSVEGGPVMAISTLVNMDIDDFLLWIEALRELNK